MRYPQGFWEQYISKDSASLDWKEQGEDTVGFLKERVLTGKKQAYKTIQLQINVNLYEIGIKTQSIGLRAQRMELRTTKDYS